MSMRRRGIALAVVAALCFAPPSNGATAGFPKVTGQNLNSKTFDLPKDFQGPASIVFVAYVREQQADIDSWKPHVAELRKRFPAIGEYEVPTLSRGTSLFRGFIDGGMRRGIPDVATRAVTITLYIDKRPFNAALDIATEEHIVVLLVKPDGTVLWRASGSYSEKNAAGLDTAIAALGT